MDIMQFIPREKENAVTRTQLVSMLALPDRKVRKLIEAARNRGEIILNDQSGAGYYTSDRLADLEAQYRANRSRAMAILRQQKHLKRRICSLERGEQMRIQNV